MKSESWFLVVLVSASGCGWAPVVEAQPVSVQAEEPVLPPVVAIPRQPVITPLTDGVHERVVRDQTTAIALQLSEATVFCSALGYGRSFLKVSVPELDWLAHFDHRVEATGLPCAAAGACEEGGLTPESILKDRPGVEVTDVRVVLFEVLTADLKAGQCTRWLREEVSLSVRGVPLKHLVEGEPVLVPLEVCRAIVERPRLP